MSLGAIGPRQSDIDKLIQRLQAKGTTTLGFAYEAGPWGQQFNRLLAAVVDLTQFRGHYSPWGRKECSEVLSRGV